ncbi:MAG: response regulator transcription factor [Lachnospiraceae bacterium]|nr:response regulator transcription factor [Lachnospiraceae bacterium]
MQINIGICDDEKVLCTQLEETLAEILTKEKVEYEIEVFWTGKSLCESMKEMKYDLIFLDIELPDMDGIAIGNYIRETLHDERVQIAYISMKGEYALRLFDFRPINFLVKPLDWEKVKKVIDKYLVLAENGMQLFTYKKKFQYYKISLEDVLYFENKGRKIHIHTLDGKQDDEFYGSMEDVYSKIKRNQFLFINQSFIVNFRYISRYKYEFVELVNGKELPVSQSRRPTIRTRYLELEEAEM